MNCVVVFVDVYCAKVACLFCEPSAIECATKCTKSTNNGNGNGNGNENSMPRIISRAGTSRGTSMTSINCLWLCLLLCHSCSIFGLLRLEQHLAEGESQEVPGC